MPTHPQRLRHSLRSALLGVLIASTLATSTLLSAGPAAALATNHLDADTESLEAGTGRWAPWYSTTITRVVGPAKVGSASLRVDLTAPYGWGVTLNNYPGFAATPGPKKMSFWALSGRGTLGASLRVKWRDAAGRDLQTDTATLRSLSLSWQQASQDVVAPSGTARVWVEVIHGSGKAGDFLYLDGITVGDRPSATSVSSTTTSTTKPPATTTTTAPAPGPGGPVPGPSAAPATPPAAMCGSGALLGPALAPLGAVPVLPVNNLYDATVANPPGTTFWLAPGVHTLGRGEFNQVIPKDGNTYIGAPGAVLDGQGVNRYAFTQRAANVTVKYLTIQNFVAPQNEGVVNQSAGEGWTIEYNTIRDNQGAGVFMGSRNVVRYNCLTSNGQYGFSMYRPPVAGGSSITDITVDHNEISNNNTADWESRVAGCGCSGGGKFWDVARATVTDNWVHHNKGTGLWADTNNIAFRIERNYINDNEGEGIWYEISYNFLIKDNTLERNAFVKGRAFASRNDPFPVGAIYIAESGGDSRVTQQYATSEIVGNVLKDNWSGVILWESSNRYCNSPANTSSGYCTKGGAATLQACTQGSIESAPYLSDCRWKTQNVWVHNNQFLFNNTAVGCGAALSCGRQGLFSEYGTYPDWSPYKGTVIQKAITMEQNNRFSDNRYVGDWGFKVPDVTLSFADWRSSPFSQDPGSTKQ